jgi:hypothetical protein
MKQITLLLLLVASTLSAQTWNVSVGANTTNYVFTNSAGVNPDYMKAGSGLQLNLGYEKALTKRFVFDAGLTYNQYNAVGDVQNIPFSYSTDFLGLAGGIGPKLEFRNDFTLIFGNRSVPPILTLLFKQSINHEKNSIFLLVFNSIICPNRHRHHHTSRLS